MVVKAFKKRWHDTRLRLANRRAKNREPDIAQDFREHPLQEVEDPRTAEVGQLPADFDADRYIDLYPDLEPFRTDPREAERHYLEFGRGEGREYKLREFDQQREVVFGQLPADFNANQYIDLYPDLEGFRGSRAQAVQHYLEFGRSEGRDYRPLSDRAALARKAARTQAAEGETNVGAEPVEKLEADAPLWSRRFNAADFRALNPDLAAGLTDRAQALSMFLEKGIARLASLSTNDRFDPDFYRGYFNDVAGLEPAEAYRHWLFEGLRLGRPGSEQELVEALTGGRTYPAAFDWEAYAAGTPTLKRGDPRFLRLRALDHLMNEGLEEADAVPIGAEASDFFELLSDHLWKRSRRSKATSLLDRAIAADPANGRLAIKFGQRLGELQNIEAASAQFRRAYELGFSSIWLYVHLIETAAQLDRFEEAYAWLAESRETCRAYGPWQAALAKTIETHFARETEAARALYHGGELDAGHARVTAVLSHITQGFRTLDNLPARLPPCRAGHVVLFANHLLPQCLHYRVEQRCEQLDVLDIPYKVFADEEAQGARQALVGARALIVYREPAFPSAIRLMLHARALGIPVFYEIDDLIFDHAHYPDAYEVLEKQIDRQAYVGLLYSVPLVRYAISLADEGIASTTALARAVAPLTLRGRCHVMPNGLDSRNCRFLASAPPPRGADEDIFVFYGSGTKAHNRNFNDMAGPPLVELMTARPNVRLVVVGYLDLDPMFDGVADRIIRYRFSEHLAHYWSALSEADINLAVLMPGMMNDCKSEIKWIEAAVSAVPSIVSASATYSEVVEDGVDGVLAQTPEGWRDALFRLVDDGDLRAAIGRRAKARVLRDYALSATAAKLGQILDPDMAFAPEGTVCTANGTAGNQGPSPVKQASKLTGDADRRGRQAGKTEGSPPSRMRVLVVNVFFPPQTFGGATRVVRDNVDDILARYSQEFELAVVTSDFDAPPDTFDVGHYRSVPVFRMGRNKHREIDYCDEVTAERFEQVIKAWRPNLVHFHCIQFLTASIVERCARADIPYVVTVHDAWWISPFQFLVDEDFFLRAPKTRAIAERQSADASLMDIDRRRYLSDRLAGAAAVTAVSSSFADIYRKAGVARTKAIPNGISSEFIGRVREGRGDRDRVRLGFLGGRSYHKGLHLLQVALQSSAFERLEVIVVEYDRQPSFRGHETWGTTPVLLRGLVPQQQMFELYETFDVLIAPSIWPESFGLVAREAAAMGLWVVVSALGALADDVVDGRNGFIVDVRDFTDLARVLRIIESEPERFLRPPSDIARLRTAAEQTDDLIALYRDVLDEATVH